jgi:WhiB family redox-sensing transcriptional regulator
MNDLGTRPHRASEAALPESAAVARAADGDDPPTADHCVRVNSRTAAGPRRSRRARPRAALSSDPIGRSAPVDLPCQVHDAELWFAEDPADLEHAKALCSGCPARLACLTGAVARQEFAGVWGGQIFDRGRIVSHKRPRGRPRKDSTAPERYPAWAQSA